MRGSVVSREGARGSFPLSRQEYGAGDVRSEPGIDRARLSLDGQRRAEANGGGARCLPTAAGKQVRRYHAARAERTLAHISPIVIRRAIERARAATILESTLALV